MNKSVSPFGLLRRLPSDVSAALRLIPSIAEHTERLHEMTSRLTRISGDTEALPPLERNMERVAETTSAIDARLREIEKAMPVLVEVQRHLDQLPETMAGLDQGIDRLSALMERILPSLDGLGVNVEALRVEVAPVTRLASRVPGQRRGD
ncbi:MAG TPA: hypothetical protein VHQ97_04235 [Solirubrobacterales bacterium]|jgi:hypothetical protein|nr:hypothetical protein [Solirubrobacterales bacterium]